VKRRDVVFAPEALDDLVGIYDYIAAHAGAVRAVAYIGRIETYSRGFDLGAQRGRRRDDIRLGLRIVGFERRVSSATTHNPRYAH
jgi:toxin ParE1/3/4